MKNKISVRDIPRACFRNDCRHKQSSDRITDDRCTFAYIKLSSGKCVAAYWEIAAHSAYDMFSLQNYLIVNFVFSHLGYKQE